MNEAYANKDREIWRREPEDFYSPSIHVTESGNIGINVGGRVIVTSVESWHEAGIKMMEDLSGIKAKKGGTMKPNDKIEVKVSDLQLWEAILSIDHDDISDNMKQCYPAAFAPDKEWEDVTDKCYVIEKPNWVDTRLQFISIISTNNFKLENNRIWRKKT